MRRPRGWGSLLVLFALLTAAAVAGATEQRDAVVRLSVEGEQVPGKPFRTVGTGFFIARPGYILTAAHVVHPPTAFEPGQNPKIEVYDAGGELLLEETAVLIAVDQEIDLALLRLDLAEHPVLPIGDSLTLETHQQIRAVLYGESRTSGPYTADGTVEEPFDSQYKGLIDLDIGNVEVSDSGSPVLDAKGRVLGVVVQGWEEVPEKSDEVFAVPINRASPLLSMAGVHHPVTLQQWLLLDKELAPKASLDHRVAEAERVIHRLKSSWRWTVEVRRSAGSDSRQLLLLPHKLLRSGYWPSALEAKIYPFASVRDESGEVIPDVGLEPFPVNDDFDPRASHQIFFEVPKLNWKLSRRARGYEKERGAEVEEITRLRIDLVAIDLEHQEVEEVPIWVDCRQYTCCFEKGCP